jgi:CheY-like chemotaxis protein
MRPGTYSPSYILIVDDDVDDHYILRRAINKVVPQVIVESVYDGTEAMTYLTRCDSLPDLIFLDLNMVKLSGKETITQIRSNPTLKDVPIAILSTSRAEAEKKACLALGANEFYSKPYFNKELLAIIREVRNRWLVHA